MIIVIWYEFSSRAMPLINAATPPKASRRGQEQMLFDYYNYYYYYYYYYYCCYCWYQHYHRTHPDAAPGLRTAGRPQYHYDDDDDDYY